MQLRITTLVEDTAGKRGLLAEHGLSFWIEAGKRKILFDTGQGLVIKENAGQLGIKLAEAQTIILSHGHYDHSGGLSEVLRLAGHPRVYMHPGALTPKYARNAYGSAREIGMPHLNESEIRARAEVVLVEGPIDLGGGIHLTGPVPRETDFEDVGGPFCTDPECRQPDLLMDDQAVFAETADGTVVISGCAHAGIVNTLRHIRRLTGGRRIDTVMGGLHLLSAGPLRMNKTVEELRRLDVRQLLPCHCTGWTAIARLCHEFPGKCAPCYVGTVSSWDLNRR